MFRLAVVVLVLTLTGGANAALLCQVWCELQAGTAAGCHEHQQGSSARLVTGETCEDLAAATAVLRREPDVRTASSAALAHTAAAPFFVICSTSRASSAYEPHAKPALQDCPRQIALRI